MKYLFILLVALSTPVVAQPISPDMANQAIILKNTQRDQERLRQEMDQRSNDLKTPPPVSDLNNPARLMQNPLAPGGLGGPAGNDRAGSPPPPPPLSGRISGSDCEQKLAHQAQMIESLRQKIRELEAAKPAKR